MYNRFTETVKNNQEKISHMWLDKMTTLKKEKYQQSIHDDLFETTNDEFVNVIFSSIQDGDGIKRVEEFAEKLIQLGWPLSYITDGLFDFRRVTFDLILNDSEQINSTKFAEIVSYIDDWIDPIVHQLVNEYSGNWHNTFTLQKIALQELSAPLIPVVDKITIMPLIGTIDTDRASLIMENLLQGVIRQNADVVLMDITGVPVVDTMVAHHIVKAAEAVNLVGATCILVGIRPEIAQTIVNLGINLDTFPTKSTLKKGFTAALEMTDRKISDDQKEENSAIDQMISSLQ